MGLNSNETFELPELKDFTALELAYLLEGLIKEVQRRETKLPELLEEMEKKTFVYTHEIELSNELNRKEKADYYEMMEDHLRKRRIAKNEVKVLTDIFGKLPTSLQSLQEVLGTEIKHKNNYFQVFERKRAVDCEEWKNFYKEELDFKKNNGY